MLPAEIAEAEVVADEAAARRAGVLVAGARDLREAADVLARLLRIPGELRDARRWRRPARRRQPVSLYACSEVSMQKFVRPTSRGQDARVARAGRAPVVERDGDRAAGPGGDRRLELVGRRAGCRRCR